jgi:magnesium chelatase subunit I
LRPQLLDRFGLSVDVKTPKEVLVRIEIIKRRDFFERDPESFLLQWAGAEQKIKEQIIQSRKRLLKITVSDELLIATSQLCAHLGADGLRGELTLMRAIRALAAYDGSKSAHLGHLRKIAPLALCHRLRRDPLDDTGSSIRIERALDELFPE